MARLLQPLAPADGKGPPSESSDDWCSGFEESTAVDDTLRETLTDSSLSRALSDSGGPSASWGAPCCPADLVTRSADERQLSKTSTEACPETFCSGGSEDFAASGSSEEQAQPNSEDAAEDADTTRMVQNLPRYASRQELIAALDFQFAGLYDYCHMPKSINAKTNQGYAFINFVSNEAAIAFSSSWNRRPFPGHACCDKPLRVTRARVQGFNNNLRHAQSKKMNRIRSVRMRPLVL